MSVPGHVTTIVTRPKRACLPIGHDLTDVQCRPRSNGARDPHASLAPILRCYYDFVQWIILLGHEVAQLVLRKSLVCLPFVTSLSQNGSLNYICGFRANSETCRAVIWLNWAK